MSDLIDKQATIKLLNTALLHKAAEMSVLQEQGEALAARPPSERVVDQLEDLVYLVDANRNWRDGFAAALGLVQGIEPRR